MCIRGGKAGWPPCPKAKGVPAALALDIAGGGSRIALAAVDPAALGTEFARGLLQAVAISSGEDDAGAFGAGSPSGFKPKRVSISFKIDVVSYWV